MSLNWNLGKIHNHMELCFHPDGEMTKRTEYIIWACMAVGIPNIAPKNYKEFYTRLGMIERLFGAWRTKDGKPRYFTLGDIEEHIGLETNATSKSNTAFLSYLKKRADRELPVI